MDFKPTNLEILKALEFVKYWGKHVSVKAFFYEEAALLPEVEIWDRKFVKSSPEA